MLSNSTTTKLSMVIRWFLSLSTIATLLPICGLVLRFYNLLVVLPFAVSSAVMLMFTPLFEYEYGEVSVLLGIAGLIMTLLMPFAAASVKKNGTVLPAIALAIFAADVLYLGYIIIWSVMDHFWSWTVVPPFVTDVLAVVLLTMYFLLRRHERKNDIS